MMSKAESATNDSSRLNMFEFVTVCFQNFLPKAVKCKTCDIENKAIAQDDCIFFHIFCYFSNYGQT